MKRQLLAAMMVLTASLPAEARADDLRPYVVQKGDNCESVALKMYGTASVEQLHRDNPSLGPTPHALKEGATLQVQPPAKVATMRNRVEVEARPTAPNAPLFRGNRVSTGESSGADLRFRDTTQLTLSEHTLVVILGASRSATQRTGDARLLNGNLRSRLSELSGRSSVDTDAGQVRLGAGEAQISVDASKTTRLAVYKGTSEVTALKKTVNVAQGFGSKTELGRAPSPPRPLPEAPRWKDGERVAVVGPTPALAASFVASASGTAPPAAQWHVQFSATRDFADPVVDTRVPARVTSVDARAVAPGKFFARVSAIDADAFEGAYGAVLEADLGVISAAVTSQTTSTLAIVGVACGQDGGGEAEGRPLLIDTTREHRIRCVAPGAPPVEWTTPARPFELQVARAEIQSAASGERELLVILRDGAGAPFSSPRVAVVVSGEDAAETALANGVYRTPLRHQPGARLAFQVKVDGVDKAQGSVDGPAPPPPAAPSRARLELGAFALGVGRETKPLQTGAGGGATLGVAFATGPVVLGAAARGSYETVDLAGTTGGGRETTAVFALPLTVRVKTATSFRPNLTVAPLLALQRRTRDDGHQSATLGGAAFTAGADFRLGAGRPFVDVGYRVSNVARRGPLDQSVEGAVVQVGYRIEIGE